MTFSNLCNEIFWKSTTDYHVTDSVDAPMNNPYELKTIEYYLYLKNDIDEDWDDWSEGKDDKTDTDVTDGAAADTAPIAPASPASPAGPSHKA